MLEKRHQLLIALSRDFKYFYDVELVFPLDQFQVSSIFNMFTENLNKPWLPAPHTEPGFVLVFGEYMEDPTNFKTVKYFLALICLKKDQY